MRRPLLGLSALLAGCGAPTPTGGAAAPAPSAITSSAPAPRPTQAPAAASAAPSGATAEPKPAPAPVYGPVEAIGPRFVSRWGPAIDLFDATSGFAASPALGAAVLVGRGPAADKVVLVAERGAVVYRIDGRAVGKIALPGGAAVAAALSKDGARVAVVTDRLRVYDVASGSALHDIDLGGAPASEPGTSQVAFHADGVHVVVTGIASARVLSLATGREIGDAHDTGTGGTFATVLSPDGRFVAAAADAGHTLKVWRTAPWAEVASLGHVESCKNHWGAVAFLQGGQRLVAVARAKSFVIADGATFRPQKTSTAALLTDVVQVSDDGTTALASDDAGRVTVVDLATDRPRFRFDAALTGAATLSTDGRHVVEHRGASLVMYETSSGARVRTFDGH